MTLREVFLVALGLMTRHQEWFQLRNDLQVSLSQQIHSSDPKRILVVDHHASKESGNADSIGRPRSGARRARGTRGRNDLPAPAPRGPRPLLTVRRRRSSSCQPSPGSQPFAPRAGSSVRSSGCRGPADRRVPCQTWCHFVCMGFAAAHARFYTARSR